MTKQEEIGVKSLQTTGYVEVIEIKLPIRFYWSNNGFDGIDIMCSDRELFEWEQEMVDKCLLAIRDLGRGMIV